MITDIMEFVWGEQIAAAEVHQVPTKKNSMLFTTKLLPSDELLNRIGGAKVVN